MVGTVLTFFAVAIITLIAAGIVLSIVGTVFSLTFGLVAFLLFKVGPILLIGWVITKIIQVVRGRDSLSTADRKWLEGE